MKGELRFRFGHVAGTHRRLERQLRPPRSPSLLVPIAILGAIGIATSSGSDVLSTRREATVSGTEVRATRVLVLVDDSGSMPPPAAVEVHVNRLRAAGIPVANRSNVRGFAIASANQYSILPTLLDRLAADQAIDTVYVVSDFSLGDDQANERAAIDGLSRALRERRARIYWASVRDVPAATYYTLARESGGAVILAR